MTGFNAYNLYPRDLTLVKYTKEQRKEHVRHSHTHVAYLPVRTKIRSKASRSEDPEKLLSESATVTRALLLEHVYFCIDEIPPPQAVYSLVGFPVQTNNQTKLRQKRARFYSSKVADRNLERILVRSSEEYGNGNVSKYCMCNTMILCKESHLR